MLKRMSSALQGAFSPAASTPAGSGKPDHYLGLDLLRGVAALAVVFFHCNERFDLNFLCPHGYLAVDFFFVLSGFVIARAYYDRLSSRTLTLARFAQMRVIRLMPLIILGTLIAAMLEFGRPGNTDHRAHALDTAEALLLGSLLLPMLRPSVLQAVIFPLNGPAWSLFFEAIANAVFAVLAKARAGAVQVGAVLTVSGALYAYGIYQYGTVDIGARPETMLFGIARVGWSFTLGIALFHLRHRAPMWSFDIPLLLLITTLVMPVVSKRYDPFDIACVFAILPLIVWLASTAQFGARGQRSAAWSGDLSYPLYALHYPLLRVATVVSAPFHLEVAGRIAMVMTTALLIVVLSAFAYALYDIPIRKWLSARLKGRSRRHEVLASWGRS